MEGEDKYKYNELAGGRKQKKIRTNFLGGRPMEGLPFETVLGNHVEEISMME